MKKINWQGRPSTATPISADNLNLMQDNIEEGIEEVNNKIPDIYSTEEIKTNKTWINGKPIYRKVVNTGKISSRSKAIPHNISNLEHVVKMSGMLIEANNFYPLPRLVPTDATTNLGFYAGLGNITISTSTNAEFSSSYVIMEYTKTTD